MGRKFSFPASLRLKSRKNIEALFASNNSVLAHPILLKFQVAESIPESNSNLIQIAFTVSKKVFSKATDRNRIKRLMRESFRLHWKEILLKEPIPHSIQLILIYLDKKELSYQEVEAGVVKALGKMKTKLK